jgi:non-ribosomal peptide synthetase component F
MTQLNNNRYKVNVLTTTTFSLEDTQGNPVDTTAFTAYTSGGTATPIGGRITLTGKANFSASHFALPFWYRQAPTNAAAR